MITYTNSLDFCPGGVPLFVRLSQYDSNFSLVFNCFSHKGDFTVENGSTAVFREHKPDGNVISIDATVSGTIVTLTPSADNAKQMTAIKGHCECEISLQKNGKELSSANFVLLVEKAPVDIDAVQSDSVVRELYDVTDRAEEILEAAQTVDEAISDLPNLIDSTLTLPNHAADALKTGDEITGLKSAILSDDAKVALLNCFAHIAWIDDQGQSYYDTLEAALYENEYPRITAVFNPGANVIYTDDALSALAPYLTVTYYETITDPGTVVAYGDYTLSGTLNVGANLILATYNGLRTTFEVTAVDFYNDIYAFSLENGLLHIATYGGGGRKYKNDGHGGCWAIFTNASTIRRSAYVTHGKEVYYNNDTLAPYDGKYPIPIPDDATSVTLSISPSSFYVGCGFIRYDSTLNEYVALTGGVPETSSSVVIQLPDGTNRFLTPNIKKSDNSTITVEPSALSIVFSE